MVGLEIKQVTLDSSKCLSDFLANAGASLNTFRYYKSRDLSVISNHLVTILLYKDGVPVAYGHIDKERSNYWLGVMVKESEVGLGYGSMLMAYLMNYCKNHGVSRVSLSVDLDNFQAINLYKKFGFVIARTTSEVMFMHSLIQKKNAK